jgi:hypothetical protein
MIDPKDPQFQEAAKQDFENKSQLGAQALDLAGAAGGVFEGVLVTFVEIAKGVTTVALVVLGFFASVFGAIFGS